MSIDKCTENPRDCPLMPRVEALERANEQHGATHRELYDRLRELERLEGIQGEQYKNIMEKFDALSKSLDEMKRDSKAIAEKLPALTHKVEQLENVSDDVDELKGKPAKRWESIVDKAIWAVCAAVIAFLLGRVGL